MEKGLRAFGIFYSKPCSLSQHSPRRTSRGTKIRVRMRLSVSFVPSVVTVTIVKGLRAFGSYHSKPCSLSLRSVTTRRKFCILSTSHSFNKGNKKRTAIAVLFFNYLKPKIQSITSNQIYLNSSLSQMRLQSHERIALSYLHRHTILPVHATLN